MSQKYNIPMVISDDLPGQPSEPTQFSFHSGPLGHGVGKRKRNGQGVKSGDRFWDISIIHDYYCYCICIHLILIYYRYCPIAFSLEVEKIFVLFQKKCDVF